MAGLSMKVKFTDRSGAVLKRLKSIRVDALEAFAVQAQVKAKQFAPYITSNLKSSITYNLSKNGEGFSLFTQTGYGGYVELGTSSRAANPYLRPGIEAATDIFESKLRRGL